MVNKKKSKGNSITQQARRSQLEQRKQQVFQSAPRKPHVPTKLDRYMNPFLISMMLLYLTEEERENFVTFDPRYDRPKAATKPGQQESAKAKKIGAASSDAKDNNNANKALTTNADQSSDDTAGKSPEEVAAMISKAIKPVCPFQNDTTKKLKANPSVSDPLTLLARLNTRRLVQRIRHYQKNHDIKYSFPPRLNTHQLATLEWEGLLQQAREKHKSKDVASSIEASDNNQQQLLRNIPTPYEMLMFSPCPRAVTALASYPRSGNSLMRNLFERTTLRVTGSDMRGGLTKHDLVGEAAVGANMVQFVKTHFPERRGTPPFRASRVVLLVRNPYDAIESFFNLMMTNTHTTSLSDEQRREHNKLWQEHVLKEIQVWRDFHEYWIAQQIPMLLVRYEDLIRYPDKVMARVLRFVLEVNNMSFFEVRLDKCIRQEQIEQLGSYKPRSGGIGKSISKYSPELLQLMNMGIVSTMQKLGYHEMLVPKPEEWKLEAVDDYAAEFIPRKTDPIIVNAGKLVRGPKQFIDWVKVRREMMAKAPEQCMCEKCLNSRLSKD
ncbi:hypothetical protein MPSEU_000300600 [Mayamaea pseudoterrestris]|nr:hypothetical protein MPSEU_000300600 [Mayamaea pseudoterrestris]